MWALCPINQEERAHEQSDSRTLVPRVSKSGPWNQTAAFDAFVRDEFSSNAGLVKAAGIVPG
jgi:hypothetical protein